MTIDPITLEVLVQGLITIVREMRATVFRTAKSVAIFEAKDFSCGLFAPDGQVLAQSEDIGSHVVPMPWSVRGGDGEVRRRVAARRRDPDERSLCRRDASERRDHHLPGVRWRPADLLPRRARALARRGRMVPGSMSGKATEIYQEGVRIPPIKIMQEGRLNQAAMDLLLANMRVPDERIGDFQAGVAACRMAETRIREYAPATALRRCWKPCGWT